LLLANSLFAPSDSVSELAEVLRRSAGVDPENSIGICYRGTDKKIEVDVAPIERYIEIASAISDMHGEQLQIFIQTDQIQARDAVVKAFGDRTKNIAMLPATNKEIAVHNLNLSNEFGLDRDTFAASMLASMTILAKCKYLILHTGNIAAWIVFYRGNSDCVYQFNATGHLVKPDLPDIDPYVVTDISKTHF
jgi:hypothetical protein